MKITKNFLSFKFFLTVLIIPFVLTFFFFATANAQEVHEDEIEAGKVLDKKLQEKQTECSSLKDSDFESLGEFYMEKMTGDSQRHELMDKHIERIHGKEGLDNMHVSMGKYYSGCDTSSPAFAPTELWRGKGGEWNMMGPGFGFSNMMGWGGFGVFSIFGLIYPILITVILVLLIIWLWKQVQKK